MMTLQTNDSRDIVTRAGMLVFATGQQAASEVCKAYSLALLGEMIHKTNQGMPYFQQVFTRAGSLAQFEASLKRRIKQVPQADAKVVAFEASLTDSELKYNAIISTRFGEITQNG